MMGDRELVMRPSPTPANSCDGQDRSMRRTFDWITEPRPENITPFQQFTVDVDWEKSPLGLMRNWPAQLRHMVLLVVQDSSPAVVYWGDDATTVYNEAYTQLIGQKHPALQGQDPKIELAELWDHFETLLANQRETAKTTVEENAFLLIFRQGFFEEAYFSWKFVPIIGDEGWVVGSHATVVEVTREVLSERRMATVRTLSQQLSGSKTIKDLWGRLLFGIQAADRDIPIALLYSVCDSSVHSYSGSRIGSTYIGAKEKSGCTPSSVCSLEGSIGIPTGHTLIPERLDLDGEQNFLGGVFRKASGQMGPILVPIERSEEDLFEGIDFRGLGTPSTHLVVFPIVPTESNTVLAFLAVGLNPQLPYDKDYKAFLHLLTGQVTSSELSAVILREEVDERQMLARQEALNMERLSKELSDSETKFARFATRAPIGLAILTPTGKALSVNPMWRELTRLELGTSQIDWQNVLCEGYSESMNENWSRVIVEKRPITVQSRIRRRWQTPDLDADGNELWDDTTVLVAMYPDLGDDGEVETVMSCITDISGLKWSEIQLRRRMDQAIEMKEQQEKFIDMTSHEMRNPLSALIGCADDIIASLTELRALMPATLSLSQSAATSPAVAETTNFKSSKVPPLSISHSPPMFDNTSGHPKRLLDEAIDAADTIIYCALHQKRIIDEILTLSRLDSNLLLIYPEPSQPLNLIRSAVKMFDAEMRRADIILDFTEEESLRALNVKWTLLDPSRVLQVIINLMTNAITFTRTEERRYIGITLGASLTKPPSSPREDKYGVEYIGRNPNSQDQTTKHEWGTGEILYLSWTVADTGRGLDESELENLFQLFKQASPKTHQIYGGSDLGLFISRQLVEMQGGAIGVASSKGKGSTFQFFIKTRRCAPAVETTKSDFQVDTREDILREACAVDLSALEIRKERTVQRKETVNKLKETESDPKLPKTLHILVVEDNLVNQKVVTKQLRKEGHVVHVANHGEEALQFIRRSEYWLSNSTDGAGNIDETPTSEKLHVVLMDLEMPVMNGLECVRNIRRFQKEGKIKRYVPIIAVTANARKDQKVESLEAGVDDVTTKPYRIKDMLRQIEEVVARHEDVRPAFGR